MNLPFEVHSQIGKPTCVQVVQSRLFLKHGTGAAAARHDGQRRQDTHALPRLNGMARFGVEDVAKARAFKFKKTLIVSTCGQGALVNGN